MRRTKEQAAETGRQILQAAEDLFLEKGYEDVTLEEIAALAGVTRGAVHWHFKNKQGLLLALRDAAQEPFRILADELAPNNGAASLKKLGDIIADLFDQMENDPRQQGLLRGMIRLDIALSEKDEPGGSTFREEINSIFVRIFQAVERDTGMPPPWTPQKAASMVSATISGLVIEWALGKGGFNISPDGSLYIRTILASLTK
ncbi:TetR/AcrR family transcriptional regulator [Rhizobium sp. S95]|uniref:TetR/AcrR family transcriptional regulator n=1 Tax=Ciceribacter sichuanensis TaxID=2949647 RepID=A0AAJ1BZM7_9HYPH|nr:TetR/AcrR family transcriptional regulator [Ciceribacter sp. S95]MCO5959142.1 TetR/AcrR family transcriptional regulator [Ciceribacter sp. S101]